MGRRTKQTKQIVGQRKADDSVLKVIAELKLQDFDGFEIRQDVLREMLLRLLELIEKEATRRPPGRPKSDRAGQIVALLMEGGSSQADARKRAAKIFRKSRETVARSHNRYRRELGQK